MAPQKKDLGKDNLQWTLEIDKAFLDALLEKMMKGNRLDGTFTTFAYDNILQVLRTSFGPHITKQHLKNRKKTLSQWFGELYDLFNELSGFSWNSVIKIFEPESQVWNDLIEKKSQAKKWMTTHMLHYDKLHELFEADQATGKSIESAKDKLKRWQKECIDLNGSLEGPTMNEMMSEIDFNLGYKATNLTAMDSFSPTYGNSYHSNGTMSSKGQKRKKVINDTMEEKYEKITLGIKELVEVMRDGNSLHDKYIALSKRQVAVQEKQAAIAEKSLAILEKSRARHYSEEEVGQNLRKLECLKITS